MTDEADWFVIVNDEIRGPFTADQMRSAAHKGLVLPSTSVRKGGTGDWFRAEQIKGLLPTATPPTDLDAPSPPPAASPLPVSPPPAPRSSPTANVSVANTSSPPPPNISVAPGPLLQTDEPAATLATSRKPRNRRRANPLPVLIVAACGIAALLGMLFWLSQPGESTPAPETKSDSAPAR